MAGAKDLGIASLFSEANLLYVSAAFGCHLGLQVVIVGAVVRGFLRMGLLVVVKGILDVVGRTLKMGNFLVGNI